MELIEIPFIILLGFIAAFLNTVGGGGSLVSVPILTFLGLPITEANATSRLAILAQNISAVGGFYSKKTQLPLSYSLWLAAVSLVGGLIGARFATLITDQLFQLIFAGVMILAVLLLVFDPFKSRKQEENLDLKSRIIGISLFFFIGIYGGFIQAGIGFLVIAVLSNVNHFDLIKVNYIKVFVAIVYTGISLLVFALEGKVNWQVGGVLAIGHAFGGWFASRWSVEKGEVWVRRIMIISIIAMALKLSYDALRF